MTSYFWGKKIKNTALLRRWSLYLMTLTLGCGTGFVPTWLCTTPQPTNANVSLLDVCFSPNGGCTDLIVQAMEMAKKEIYMAGYSFTSKPIADALLAAKKRGIKVCIYIDSGQYKAKKAFQVDRLDGVVDYLGIDPRSSYAHDKFLVLDEECVITGSFNWDENAEKKNRENVLRIRNSPKLANAFLSDWMENKQKCQRKKVYLLKQQKKKQKKT